MTVDADGPNTYVQDDPGHRSVTVDGTLYQVVTETISISNDGGTDNVVHTLAGSTSPRTCVYATQGVAGGDPHRLGQVWNVTYTLTCGTSTPTSNAQSGGVDDIESVSVPAGTYTAIKLHSTLTWTNPTGTPLVNGHPVLVTLGLQGTS